MFDILPFDPEEGTAAEEDDVDPVGKAVALEPERLSHEPLGAIALRGEVEGALARDDAEAPCRVGLAADPQDHQAPCPALAAVERLAKLRLTEKPCIPTEAVCPGL